MSNEEQVRDETLLVKQGRKYNTHTHPPNVAHRQHWGPEIVNFCVVFEEIFFSL